MSNSSFEIDFWALLILLLLGSIIALTRQWGLQFGIPHLLFSNLKDLKNGPSTWRTRFARLTQWLGYIALGLFALAFIDPRFYLPKEGGLSQLPSKGIAIYFVLDQSGSMKQKIVTLMPSGAFETTTKVNLLKKITSDFVNGDPQLDLHGRPNDMLGLVYFARTANVIAPLTLDHKTILKDLSKFSTVEGKNNDGTAIGYAIFKTTNIIAATRNYAEELSGKQQPSYDIKNSIIILVTDGFQDPNPEDENNPLRNIGVLEAAQYAKEKKVRVYIINVDPALSSEQFAPNRRQMQQVAETTGGHYYIIDNSTSLSKIYSDIDKLEKSILPTEPGNVTTKDDLPHLFQRISLYPALIALGMLILLISILVKSKAMRQLP